MLIVGCCRRSWVLVHGVVLGHVCCWWGGAGSGLLSLPLVGWCWAIVIVRGVVLGRSLSSPLVGWCWAIVGVRGVVMGHHLGGWWWALIAVRVDTLPLHSIMVMVACRRHPSIVVVLCWVQIG